MYERVGQIWDNSLQTGVFIVNSNKSKIPSKLFNFRTHLKLLHLKDGVFIGSDKTKSKWYKNEMGGTEKH